MKYLLIVLGLTIFVSCHEKEENSMGGTSYIFENQPSDYLLMKNAYRVDVGSETGESKFEGTYRIENAFGEPVKFSDYILQLYTMGYTIEMTLQPGFNVDDFKGEPDVEMEKQLNQYFTQLKSTSTSSVPEINVVTVEYRTEELKSLVVKSDKVLFGIAAGESLNSYIEIFSGSLLFDYSKQLIGGLEPQTSIEKYLNYRPLVCANMELRFKSVPPELPVSAKLIVEMELSDGKTLKDTSDVVELMP